MMKICPTCATENSDASQRCSACGVPLEPATVKVVWIYISLDEVMRQIQN